MPSEKYKVGLNEWGLNQKQEAFCYEYVKNGGVAKEAYLTVYQSAENVASASAHNLMKKEGVQNCIKSITDKIRSANLVPLNEIVNNLRNIETETRKLKKYDTALDCNKFMAQLMGYTQKFNGDLNATQNNVTIKILPPNSTTIENDENINIEND